MLVNRIAMALKKQDWVTVIIELALVFAGVFVALQFDNWNEHNRNQKSLTEVLQRISSELDLNEEVIDKYKARLEESQQIRELARLAIFKCDSTEMARTHINEAITILTGDFSPSLSNETLPQLNRRDPYLDLLSSEFRWALAVYSNHIHEEQLQLQFNAGLRWDQHVMKHPFVAAYMDEESVGLVISENISVSQVCEDASFTRQFFITSVFLDSTMARLERFRTRMNTFRTELERELAKRT